MKLNVVLPKWIAWPLRLTLYAFVMFILFNIAVAFVAGRGAMNAAECNELVSIKGGALDHAKTMVSCLKNKNGIFENLLMRSTYAAIDALPNAPKEFVGVWDAAQPHCSYRHTLKESGEFISEPKGCSPSAETYHGAWGVYDNKVVWLADEGVVWPPDINPMDIVDRDFFLLVEPDGSRTKFSRVALDSIKDEVASFPQDQKTVNTEQSNVEAAVIPAPVVARHADGEYAYLAQSLHYEEQGLEIPPGSAFNMETLDGKDSLDKFLSTRLADKVRNIVTSQGCKLFPLNIYHKQGASEKIIQTSCFVQGEFVNEYPVTLVTTEDSIQEIVEMHRYGFMYQSGTLKAVTDIDSNGHLELWLEGSICECDGEGDEPCDCTGISVVEER